MSKTIVLCGRGRCCPEVRLEDDEVFITDDYGNEVRMTREQLDDLIERADRGEFA